MAIDIEKAKAALEKLRSEYQARIDKISDHIQHPEQDTMPSQNEPATRASLNDMRTLLKQEAEEGLAHVKVALARIAGGTYGVCDECGEEISEKRMQAVPYATLCMKHAK